MSESYAGITVPEGEPDGLRAAAGRFHGLSGSLEGTEAELSVWRWKRGGKDDDGCLPDTYGVKPDELMNLMWAYWDARRPASAAQARAFETF